MNMFVAKIVAKFAAAKSFVAFRDVVNDHRLQVVTTWKKGVGPLQKAIVGHYQVSWDHELNTPIVQVREGWEDEKVFFGHCGEYLEVPTWMVGQCFVMKHQKMVLVMDDNAVEVRITVSHRDEDGRTVWKPIV